MGIAVKKIQSDNSGGKCKLVQSLWELIGRFYLSGKLRTGIPFSQCRAS